MIKKDKIDQDPLDAKVLESSDKTKIGSSSLDLNSDECIELLGVSTNNLKNINLKIPLNQITVVTGLSGSGKSSLVFDTLHAESYRRYVESLSSFARQYIKAVPRPKIDSASNLPASIAVQQVKSSTNSRSTVGTTTEILDLVRIVCTYKSKIICPNCHREVRVDSSSSISKDLLTNYPETKILILVAICGFDIKIEDLRSLLLSQGFIRAYYSGEFYQIEQMKESMLKKSFVVVDRIRCSSTRQNRLDEALSLGLKLGKGKIQVLIQDENNQDKSQDRIIKYSSSYSCPDCEKEFHSPTSTLFSFNHPMGACPQCQGFGYEDDIDWKKFYSERKKSHFNLYPKKRSYHLCSLCHGKRLNSDSLCYKVFDEDICQVSAKTILELKSWFKKIKEDMNTALPKFDGRISSMGLEEAVTEGLARIGYLEKIGVSYLSLDRLTRSLSGGERQRINMARCLGSSLTEVMYCLDEPSVGLHPLDSSNLISVLKDFRDNHNTVVVVEHESSIIKACDHLIEIGPGSGHLGGQLVYEGSYPDTNQLKKMKEKGFIPSWFLSTNIPESLPLGKDQKFLTLSGVKTNNLKNISVRFPYNKITTVCGISGSGKTSLVEQSLYPLLSKCFGSSTKQIYFPKVDSISKMSDIEKYSGVIHVSQSAMVRSSRSNIATYLGIADELKKIFSSLPLSKKYHFSPSYFSFNTVGGRCETCRGLGVIEEDMSFLGELDIICPTCNGRRFNDEILQVKYKDKNFIDILNLTVDEARSFFMDQPKIKKILDKISDFGLGYLNLGQSSSSFSGGEAQRVKLLKLLLENKGKDSYFLIFDEPTTGLSRQDVSVLIKQFRLLAETNTVIIVEHHTDIIKASDWVIEIGPEAGSKGGYLIYEGEVSGLKNNPSSLIAPFL